MKFKRKLIALAVIAPSLAFGIAQADSLDTSLHSDVNSKGNIGIQMKSNEDMQSNQDGDKIHSTSSVHIDATSSKDRGNRNDQGDKYENQDGTNSEMTEENASTTPEAEEKDMSGEHRSFVSSFVHSLLQVADREGGIGAEVRSVAHDEEGSATTTESAMEKVDAKGGVATYFFGSDYKNLGVIRSELETTTKDMARLQALLASTTNATNKATLTAQIQALQTEKTKVDAYVTAHEDTFSLFGWFVKFFSN